MKKAAGLVGLMICLACFISMAMAGTTPSECKQERKLIQNACYDVVFGKNPTASCCLNVRSAHVECVCPYVTPKLANFINVNAASDRLKAAEGLFLATSSVGVSSIHFVSARSNSISQF